MRELPNDHAMTLVLGLPFTMACNEVRGVLVKTNRKAIDGLDAYERLAFRLLHRTVRAAMPFVRAAHWGWTEGRHLAAVP